MKRFIFSAMTFLGLSANALGATWINAANGQTGANPVWVGREGNADAYVCRANNIPGKLIKRDGKCYIGYYGKEYAYTSYQVLQNAGRYRFWSSTSLSDDYIVLGGSENGTPLHICRVRTSAGHVGGKLVGGVNGICYYGYYGQEYSSRIFDALSDA